MKFLKANKCQHVSIQKDDFAFFAVDPPLKVQNALSLLCHEFTVGVEVQNVKVNQPTFFFKKNAN